MRTDQAARDIRSKRTEYISDPAQRPRIGQIEDAQQSAEYNDVLQQVADLTAGHGTPTSWNARSPTSIKSRSKPPARPGAYGASRPRRSRLPRCPCAAQCEGLSKFRRGPPIGFAGGERQGRPVSGEKAHRANVVSAEELHRRAVTAARARCEALEGQLANLASQLHATVPLVTGASSGDLGALQSAEQALHSAIRDAKSALSLQQSRARLELVTTRIEIDAPDLVTLGIAERSATNNQQPKIARVLERLSLDP